MGHVWFVCDVLGIVFASLVWLLVFSVSAVLFQACLLPAGNVTYTVTHGTLFHLLAFLGLVSHARAVFTDPGSVPLGPRSGEPVESCCSVCGCNRPPGAKHCFVCGRCIRRMDHHCPWINNCVGEDNCKFFVLFMFYMALASLYLLLLLLVPNLRGSWPPSKPLIFLFLVSLEGFLFTAVMLTIQICRICVQGERDRPGWPFRWMNLKDVFGHHMSLAWINPFVSPELQTVGGHYSVA